MRYRKTSSISGCGDGATWCANEPACGYVESTTTSTWVPYGFADPDHPIYNYGLPSNLEKSLGYLEIIVLLQREVNLEFF
jgi:hypothetical protein